MDAGDAALRGSWVTAVFGQDESAPVAGKETADLEMERSLDSVTDDFIRGVRFLLALIRPHRNEA